MTTVAWDGIELAADCMSHFGDTPLRCRKIFKLRAPNGRIGLFGFCGNLTYARAYRTWLVGGPEPSGFQADTQWQVMCIDDTGMVWWRGHTGNAWDAFGRRQWAFGSGADYALGAMAAGMSATTAVRIAAKLDIQTGYGVDVVRF